MDTTAFLPRILAAASLFLAAMSEMASAADVTHVIFDLPDTIECQDVTPERFAAKYPSLKVIEAKLRISARIVDGSDADIVDFLYMITSPGLRLKIEDYLPNTTLESTVEGDQIEIADSSESTKATAEDAHINYKVLALGGTKNQGSKKTQSSHYKQIASKALVVASGTTDREHGVYFKLRPSKGASLEGAKTFTFLAIVPAEWRGDWCVVSCAARAKKKSFFSTAIDTAGVEQAHVGMYLSGDREARFRADGLFEIQQTNQRVLSAQLAKQSNGLVTAMHAATTTDRFGHSWLQCLFGVKPATDGDNQDNDDAQDEPSVEQRRFEVQKQMMDAEDRLDRLSGSGSY